MDTNQICVRLNTKQQQFAVSVYLLKARILVF
jgi:hypothetical protein